MSFGHDWTPSSTNFTNAGVAGIKLYQIKLVNTPAWWRKWVPEVPLLSKELPKLDGFWEREAQFCLRA